MATPPTIPTTDADGTLNLEPVSGTHSVPAVEKAFIILEVLARSRTGLTLRELASHCGIPKSSVHGIVVTLQRCGYLYRKQRSSRYLFARKLLRLANDALSGLELRERAEPHMRSLARKLQLPVHLGIVEFDEAVIVAKTESVLSYHPMGSWVGKRMELHCTGLGKALIAHWNDAELERLAQERTLPRHNDNTISSLRRLKEDLATVRRVGYAIDDEEDVLGFRCVGASVQDGEGGVIAALSASGTTADITSENVHTLARELMAVTHAFSRDLASACSPATTSANRVLQSWRRMGADNGSSDDAYRTC
jgi:DNA-binding IclR family transcriptional regulator